MGKHAPPFVVCVSEPVSFITCLIIKCVRGRLTGTKHSSSFNVSPSLLFDKTFPYELIKAAAFSSEHL